MAGCGTTGTPSAQHRGRRVLVTGGAGFIGVWLCRELDRLGFDVVVVDDLRTTPLQPHTGELRRKSVLDMEPADLDEVAAVYHLASRKNVAESHDQPLEYLENVDAVRHLLQLCAQVKVPRLVLASSCEVYGIAPELPTPETTSFAPRSPYARTKVVLEMLAQAYQQASSSGSDVTIARFFNVYGPGERPDAVVPALCLAAADGSQMLVEGSGAQRRDFSYVTDVVAKLVVLLDTTGLPVVNIGSGRSASVLELVELVRELKPGVEVEWRPGRPHEIPEFLADTALAGRHLGDLDGTVGLREGVARTYDWWVKRVRAGTRTPELVGDPH